MGDVLPRALSLIAIVGLGQLAKKFGWVRTSDFGMFSLLVLRITLPAALVTSFNTITITSSLLLLTVIGIVVNLAYMAAGYLMERRHGRDAQAFGLLNTGSWNIGAFATPYTAGLLGAGAVVYTSMIDIGNSLAVAGLAYATAVGVAQGRRPTPRTFLTNMFTSPIFVTYLVLLVIRSIGWHFPHPVLMFTGLVGQANTFLAMFMIGVGLQFDLDATQLRRAARFLAVRYGLAALVIVSAWTWLPLPHMARVVLTMVVFSPMAVMVSGFTAQVKGDVALSTFMTTCTVLVAVLVMPLVAGVAS